VPRSAPADWTSSSHSGDSGQCVQWRNPPGMPPGQSVEIRDSKNPNGPTLIFPMETWSAFAGFAATLDI